MSSPTKTIARIERAPSGRWRIVWIGKAGEARSGQEYFHRGRAAELARECHADRIEDEAGTELSPSSG